MNPLAEPLQRAGMPIDPTRLETTYPVEDYSPERIAEFLLNNAVGTDGYAAVRQQVLALGLDPDRIPHEKPPGA